MNKRALAACKKADGITVRNGVPKIRGVSVEIIVSRFRAGDGIEALAEDYEISFNEVCQAIRAGAR